MFFREAAGKFNSVIAKGNTYVFSCGQVKQKRDKSDIEMVFYRDSIILPET